MKKEITILAVLILATVIATVFAVTMLAHEITSIVDEMTKPYVCIPNIEESYEGDKVYFYCYRKDIKPIEKSSNSI